jgi:hypothetical protein
VSLWRFFVRRYHFIISVSNSSITASLIVSEGELILDFTLVSNLRATTAQQS